MATSLFEWMIHSKQTPKLGSGTGIQKETVGLALSLGSFPGALVTSGIMRGFQRKSILIDGEERPAMEGFDYMSASSGGNLAMILYAFAQGTTSNELLDVDGIGHPSEITKEELENIPESSIFSLFTNSVLNPLAYGLIVSSIFDTEDFWETVAHKMFLEPFGIDRHQPIGETRGDVKATPLVTASVVGPAEIYPDYTIEEMGKKFHETWEENSHLFTPIEDAPSNYNLFDLTTGESFDPKSLFQTVIKKNESDALWEIAKLSSFQIPYAAIISPDEFSIPIQEHREIYETVDPFDFLPVGTHPDNVQPQLFSHYKLPKTKFPLAKMLAVSTNLLPIISDMIPEALRPLLFKPNNIEIPTADGSKRKLALADGGYNSHNGLPSLVKKGVKKIVCNLYGTLSRSFAPLTPSQYYYVTFNEFAKLFGVIPTPESIDSFPATSYSKTAMLTNHMFDLYSNNENQILKFYDMIESLDNAGEPLIATLKGLDVVENKFWGIQGGGKVDLTVILNVGVPKKFSDQVPKDVAPAREGMNFTNEYGYFTNEDLQFVPNLPSFAGNIELNIPVFNLTQELPLPEFATGVKATRMTEILCSWMIEHAWEGLVGDDGEVKFEGFKEIFE